MLPIHPQPLENEIISSWMVRLAFSNGYPLHTFYSGLLAYRKAIWNRDVDRQPSADLLEILARLTGQSVMVLNSMTLATYEGTVFESLTPAGRTAWILPVGVFHRTRRRAGLQFCPRCIEGDTNPYYRKTWRLALYSMCEVHLCVMHETCPECRSNIAFHRLGIGRGKDIFQQDLNFCHGCGFDLGRTPTSIPNWPDIRSLNGLKNIVGHFDLRGSPYGLCTTPFSIPFFQGVRVLVGIINGRNGMRLRQVLTETIGVEIGQGISRLNADFEYQPADVRLNLLLTVCWLMEDWPYRFVAACSKANFTRSRVAEEVRTLPFWIARVADEFLDNRVLMPSRLEVQSACVYLMSSHREVSPQSLGALLGLSRDAAIASYKLWKLSAV